MDNAFLLDIQNSWTKTQEQLLRRWHKFALGQYWKHLESAKYCNTVDKWLGIPAVGATAVTGTALFITFEQDSGCDGNVIIQLLLGVVIIMAALLSAIQQFLRLSELAEKHRNSSGRYQNFANSIESELVMPRDQRLNGKIFLKQAQKRLGELLDICPEVPDRIEKKYKKVQNKSELSELIDVLVINDEMISDARMRKILSENENNELEKQETEEAFELNEIDSEDEDNNINKRRIKKNIKVVKEKRKKVKKIIDNDNKPKKNTLQEEIDKEIQDTKIKENLQKLQEEQKRGQKKIINRISNYLNL